VGQLDETEIKVEEGAVVKSSSEKLRQILRQKNRSKKFQYVKPEMVVQIIESLKLLDEKFYQDVYDEYYDNGELTQNTKSDVMYALDLVLYTRDDRISGGGESEDDIATEVHSEISAGDDVHTEDCL
jgi:hypothetical protein